MAVADDDAWTDALTAVAVLAVDPVGLGGAWLRARSGPQRDQWLATLHTSLPADTPWRRLPLGIADERLLGGLDLAATLQAGRPVAQRGLLAEADGGLVLAAMAERLAPGTAARLAAVLDRGEVQLQRDGLAQTLPGRFGLLLLDEGVDDDEQAPAALADRLAFHLRLDGLPVRMPAAAVSAADVLAARQRLPQVRCDDDTLTALCQAADALGVPSARAAWLALRTACAVAALQAQDTVDEDAAALAVRLVLLPRATRLPAEAAPPSPDEPAPPEAGQDAPDNADTPEAPPPAEAHPPPPDETAAADPTDTPGPPPDGPLDERLLEAALASLPPGLLARLKAGRGPRLPPTAGGGRFGQAQPSRLRGRPLGSRRGELRAGARLDLIATLRAAAPWQALRRRALADAQAGPQASAALPAPPAPNPPAAGAARRVLVQRDDFHITRYTQRRETTTVFIVDASGSAALHRLAEAKGAVELLLAECYVRRDRVALIAFRGAGAELLLPPTRSLLRAKRALAGQVGGGGTPLASALDAAAALQAAISRRGGTPLLVLLSDGRANINRQGQGGRASAMADALASAHALRASGVKTLVVDTSPPASGAAQPAKALADALDAFYLPLPQADARGVARVVGGLASPRPDHR